MTSLESASHDFGVSQHLFEIITWTGVALAILTVAGRIVIRFRMQDPIQLDDYLLIFALACLVSLTAYTQSALSLVYKYSSIGASFDPSILPPSMGELLHDLHTCMRLLWTFMVLANTAVYAAKFAYLVFFKRLIIRQKRLTAYWWVVVVITALSYVASMVVGIEICPWDDLRVLQCLSTDRLNTVLGGTVAIIALDPLTDLMVFSIPVCILYKVKIKTSQKLGLSLFLCSSVILFSFAMIRLSRCVTVFNKKKVEDIWIMFWTLLEASLSIFLVSLTAFRSFFVYNERRRNEHKVVPYWYSSAVDRIKRKQNSRDHGLPLIPSGDITGLRSMLRNNDFDSTLVNDAESKTSREGSFSEHQDISRSLTSKTFQTHTEEILGEADATEMVVFAHHSDRIKK